MAATYLHLKDMGWEARFEGSEHVGFIVQEGATWNFNHEISWHDFEEQIRELRE